MKRSILAVVAAVACAGALAGTAVARTAQASSATQTCSKISASSVSAAIGYKVPAAVGTTLTAKATKLNDHISGSTLSCSFGSDTSLATIKKSVQVSLETVSKPLSIAVAKQLVQKTATLVHGLHVKISSYSGLGGVTFLLTFSEGGLSIESLVSVQGTKLYGGTVYGNLATSKLASLVKLAEKL